jgi:hypothetical protein
VEQARASAVLLHHHQLAPQTAHLAGDDRLAIVNLITSTTTRSGLKVLARLDEGSYPAKVTVSDAELDAVNLHRHACHPRMELHHRAAT